MKEGAGGSNEGDTRRQKENLDSRERKLHEMQTNLQAEIKRLNEENRNLLEKAKEIEERESDLQLKSLELENKTREGRAPGMRDMGREGQLEEWERRLREREEDLKRRTYQKEKEMEMREGAVKARITTPAGEAEAEEAIAVEKKADRVKTGTPRLDDLLYGGIPFNSNVLFVGPAFVGKEIALLNFIAEGLKKGIPVIIITTTKLPIDIAKDIATILPTFVEYDQLGLVRWIDCTSPMASGKPVKEKNVWRVNGPTDFDNIYQLVGQLDEEFKKKHPYFRLAYLTLSSSITQADEREAMSFVQRLVNRLRQTKAVSAIALERGMHTDQTLEALEHMVDGAIHFKSDKQKTMLQVVGLGEIQTHDWVPYKFTNKALMIGSFQLERIRCALLPSHRAFPELLREHHAGDDHCSARDRADRQGFSEDHDPAEDRDERARVDVRARRRRGDSLQRAEPDSVPDKCREDAEVQDRDPTSETHRLQVGQDAPSRHDQERHQEDRSDEEGPRDKCKGRVPPEVALAEDRVEGGEDRRRDDRQGAFGGAERELTLRPNEEDHDREAGEGEGDPRGLPPADPLLQEGNREDRDERGGRGDDQGGRARADVRIRLPQVQEEMITGESEECEEDEHREVLPCRRMPY